MNNLALIPKHAKQIFIPGPVGKLDCLELTPSSTIKGIAIICHPDPKGGGTYTNKIVQTLAKTLNHNGYICYCPNLRGVGLSDGTHDFGVGEIDDINSIYEYIREQFTNLPIVLAGFSFGTAVISNLANRIEHEKLILVGPAVTRYKVFIPDPHKTIVIQGEEDEIIDTPSVLNWAKQNNQAVIWVPNCGHFFHGKLIVLQNILNNFRFCS